MRPIDQQIILVTGATDGLGRAVAGELAGQGATLLIHGRNEERGNRTLSEIRARTGNNKLAYYQADFESLSEVRDLAERIQSEHERLDVLLNNAALGIDAVRRVSSDGHESTFQVNPTKIVTHMFTPQSEIADGVRSTLRLIDDPTLEHVTGRYFDQTQEARAHPQAYDERARARVRGIAEQLAGVPAGRIPDPHQTPHKP